MGSGTSACGRARSHDARGVCGRKGGSRSRDQNQQRPEGSSSHEEPIVGVVSTPCFACGGPYHPATGHVFRGFNVPYCGACYRRFLPWLKGHTRRLWGGREFYVEALVSCSAVRLEDQ